MATPYEPPPAGVRHGCRRAPRPPVCDQGQVARPDEPGMTDAPRRQAASGDQGLDAAAADAQGVSGLGRRQYRGASAVTHDALHVSGSLSSSGSALRRTPLISLALNCISP